MLHLAADWVAEKPCADSAAPQSGTKEKVPSTEPRNTVFPHIWSQERAERCTIATPQKTLSLTVSRLSYFLNMDPFSITVGTVSVVDVCVRVVKCIKDFHEASDRVDAEILALQQEFEALIALNESIHSLFEEELQKVNLKQEDLKGSPGQPLDDSDDSDPVQNLWREIGRNLQDCEAVVKNLEEIVQAIVGKQGVAKESSKIVRKFEGYRRSKRKESKEGDFRQLRSQLTTFQRALQMLMTAITTLAQHVYRSRSSVDTAIDPTHAAFSPQRTKPTVPSMSCLETSGRLISAFRIR